MDSWLLFFTAVMVAVPASLLGVYLVLKKNVMIGDAISHAVLPGIVIAFMITGSRASLPMLLGASAMGVITTVLIQVFSQRLRIQSDAAVGTVFTFLFALGVLLIAFYSGNNTDLDQDCVLYGDLEFTVLNPLTFNGYMVGTEAMTRLIPLNVLVILAILIAYRPLALWAFNHEFGTIRGFKMQTIELLFMTLVSIQAVFSFESVGAIMVVGMLVIPAATTYLLVQRLNHLLLGSVIVSVLSCGIGVLAASYWNVSTAPSIVVAAGGLFLISWGLVKLKEINS